MENEALAKHVESMGARVKFRAIGRGRQERGLPSDAIRIDVLSDKQGEYYDIARGSDAPEFELLQAKPKERHLLLYARDGQRFLLGFDERHWFAAGIGDAVSTIRDAKLSLVPPALSEHVRALPPRKVDNRKNAAFKRQGEWFFVPAHHLTPDEMLILKNEPLQRSAGGKAHICQELYREGGEQVYVVRGRVYTEDEFQERMNTAPNFARTGFTRMTRNPDVYVRGTVKHDDHATIDLPGWHRVYLNGELTTSSVTFLD
jgi:hypothetical protein